jgi:MarR family transcriptional regulator, organic hydroperoxide resistance regulator
MSNTKRAHLFETLILEMRQFIAGVILYNQGVAERLGIHVTDLQGLGILEALGPVTPGKLAEGTGLTTGGVTVMLDRLERAGFVRRERNPNDRRSVLVQVNTAHKKKLYAPYQAIQEEVERLVSGYSDAELNTVIDFFQKSNSMRVDPGGNVQSAPKNSAREERSTGRLESAHDAKKDRHLGRLAGKAGHPSVRRGDA